MNKLKALVDTYGPVAIGTYLVLFVLVMGGAVIAINFGFEVEGATGNVGMLGAAWVFAKVTQPLRIAASLALTPLVARLIGRKPVSTEPPTAGS